MLSRQSIIVAQCCLLLLVGLFPLTQVMATRPGKPAPPNTLLTGTLQSRYNYLLKDSLLVEVYQRHHCVARTWSDNGMFRVDLADKVDPQQHITVVVRGQLQDRGHLMSSRRFLAAKQHLHLASAQNIVLLVEKRYPRIHKLRRSHGCIPGRRGTKTLYINNI